MVTSSPAPHRRRPGPQSSRPRGAAPAPSRSRSPSSSGRAGRSSTSPGSTTRPTQASAASPRPAAIAAQARDRRRAPRRRRARPRREAGGGRREAELSPGGGGAALRAAVRRAAAARGWASPQPRGEGGRGAFAALGTAFAGRQRHPPARTGTPAAGASSRPTGSPAGSSAASFSPPKSRLQRPRASFLPGSLSLLLGKDHGKVSAAELQDEYGHRLWLQSLAAFFNTRLRVASETNGWPSPR